MKKQMWVVLLISISIFVVGCEESKGESTEFDQEVSTQNEEETSGEGNRVMPVGTPNTSEEGPSVIMNQEISESKKMEKVEDVLETAEKIAKPQDKVNEVPDVYFKLPITVETEQKSSVESRFVWYQEDGSAVLLAHGSANYFIITSGQAEKLKEALGK